MREQAKDKGRLEHIVKYASNVEEMTRDANFEQFAANKVLYYAVMKNIEVVGEAAYMLTKEFLLLHPELPWKEIIGMRHILVHGYATVQPRKLWDTAIYDIPKLKQQVLRYLETLK